MANKRALIVDDEPDIRELLEITLGRMKIETWSAANLGEAHRLLSAEQFDLCLTDMNLPDGNGIDLVKFIAANHPHLPVAVITAFGSMEAAIAALKAGAFDFVQPTRASSWNQTSIGLPVAGGGRASATRAAKFF